MLLDSLNLEYISQNFSDKFSNTLKNLNVVANRIDSEIVEKIDFIRKFKFIFCLRDGNYAELNANNGDKLFSNTEHLNLELTFNGKLYKDILNTRIAFAKEVCPKDELDNFQVNIEKVQSNIDSILTDDIFEIMLRPLYNYDFRKVSTIAYLSLFRDYFTNMDLKKELKDFDYGTRSLLIFSFVAKLGENNFIKLFTDVLLGEGDEEQGYCNPMRLILILVLNLCHKRISNQKQLALIQYEVPLYELLESFDQIHSNELFFDILYKSFVYHRTGWVNLITIKNKSIRDDEKFENELNLINELKELNFGESSAENLERKKEIVSELNKIKVRVNPSGFTFLRYINPRFEYYSILAKNESPLFGELNNIKNGVHNYRRIISKVLTVVKLHQRLMRRFFEVEFDEKRKIDVRKYKYYTFSFKFFGTQNEARSKGFFHILRILTIQMDHLSQFRLYIIKKWSNIPEFSLINFNRTMYGFLMEYLRLLENCIDPESKEFVKIFKPNILKIKQSNYLDRNTEITKKTATNKA